MGGSGWTLIAIGVGLLAIVLFWAMMRNKDSQEKEDLDRTEEATARLYQEEDAARDPMDDGTV